MRIRSILIITFLFATLVPSAFFGWWSYQQGIEREFGEVKDRHLLLAQNLGRALERYHIDLVAASETITGAMLSGKSVPDFHLFMKRLGIECVMIIDRDSGRILLQENADQIEMNKQLSAMKLSYFRSIAFQGWTSFSTVMQSRDGNNVRG